VSVQTFYEVENNVAFPAVKICNKQPFVTEYAKEYLAAFFQQLLNETIPKNLTTLQYINKNIFNPDLRLLILASVYKLNQTEKQRMGLTRKELVVKCRIMLRDCDDSDFTWVYDYSLGNCFTFNMNRLPGYY